MFLTGINQFLNRNLEEIIWFFKMLTFEQNLFIFCVTQVGKKPHHTTNFQPKDNSLNWYCGK
jgi:hypothetical protein